MPSTDLASLMQVAPYAGAGFIAQNQAMDQQSEALRQQELAQLISARTQDQQFNLQKQPLTLQQMGLQNQTTQAQLPGIQAKSDFDQQTLAGNVAAKNAANSGSIQSMIGSHLAAVADQLRDLPDAQKPQAFAASLDNLNITPQQKQQLLQHYTQYAPSVLADKLERDSTKLMAYDPTYNREIGKTQLETSARLQEAAMAAQAHIQSSQILAGGRVDAVRARADGNSDLDANIRNAKNTPARYSALIDAWSQTKDTDPERAAGYAERIRDLAPFIQASTPGGAPKAGTVAPGQMGVPTNPAPQVLPPGIGSPQATQAGVNPMTPAAPAADSGRVSVISPDGKRGTIPAAQLQQAIAHGYKQAQ